MQSPTVGTVVGETVVERGGTLVIGKEQLIACNKNVFYVIGCNRQVFRFCGKVRDHCALFLAPSILLKLLGCKLCHVGGILFNQSHIFVIVAVNGIITGAQGKLNITDSRKITGEVIHLDVHKRCYKLLVIALGYCSFTTVKNFGICFDIDVRRLIIEKIQSILAELLCFENKLQGGDQSSERNAVNSSLFTKRLECLILFGVEVGGKANTAAVFYIERCTFGRCNQVFYQRVVHIADCSARSRRHCGTRYGYKHGNQHSNR